MSSTKEQPKEGKKMPEVLNLNNEVVRMRKDVKRLRALIIRKLTRQIAALKKKKGNEEDLERNKRRVARLLEEIHEMKVLKPDQVTKAALQKNLSFEKVCKNPSATLSDRATARLATHPQFSKKIDAIKAAIKAFKEERTKEAGIKNGDKTRKGEKQPAAVIAPLKDRDEEEQEEPEEEMVEKKEAMADKLEEEILEKKEEIVNKLETERLEKVEEMVEMVEEIVEIDDKVRDDSAEEEGVSKGSENTAGKEPATNVGTAADRPLPREGETLNHTEPNTQHKVLTETLASELTTAQNRDTYSLTVKTNVDQETPVLQKGPKLKPETKNLEPQCNDEEEEEVVEEGDEESDLESSEDEEEKEYFDDSTEERFRKQSSQSEESEDDDFFLGKVQKYKKKRSQFAPRGGGEKKREQETDSTEPLKGSGQEQDELDELESRLNSKANRMKSVFCSSLSTGAARGSRGGGQSQRGGGRGGSQGRGRGGGFHNQTQRGGGPDRFSKGPSRFQKQGRGTERKPALPRFNSNPRHNDDDAGHESQNKWVATAGRGRGRGRGRGDVSRQQDRRGAATPSHHAPQQALHPSWEASKKRKEQHGQIQAFQGKKIKFDDD